MKFILSTSQNTYEEVDKSLEELGFSFSKPTSGKYRIEGEPEIEINTLEELISLSNKFDDLIIYEGSIEIYNGYRE